MLTDEEKADLWRAVAEAVTIPVIAGTGSNDTEHSVQVTALAASCGVDGVLVVTPYYNRPSQSGIYEHFRAVAEAAGGLPVTLYDIPVRTGRRIAALHASCAWPTTCRPSWRSRTPPVTRPGRRIWRPGCPAGFEIYSGDDVMTLPLLAVGAVGRHQRGRRTGSGRSSGP